MNVATQPTVVQRLRTNLNVRSSRLPLLRAHRPATAARHHADTTLTDWGLPRPAIDDALVVVSELVTNAERHAAGGPVELHLLLHAGRLLIAVRDRCPASLTTTARHTPRTEEECGRGLFIVQALATSFGCRRTEAGKTTWAWLPTAD
ncbi:ATP-binding protein [Streptomyces sp. NPDC088915]|uniref:ATP-binding protein n=1 Tax=Streptomyces sp. NPDC088915 TaxID=3365912 RepID=UPI0037F80005